MAEVTIRDLRNKGGQIVDRVAAGERLIVTRDGDPVAELRPLQREGLSARHLLDRWRHIPQVDPRDARADLDRSVDPSL